MYELRPEQGMIWNYLPLTQLVGARMIQNEARDSRDGYGKDATKFERERLRHYVGKLWSAQSRNVG